MLVKIGMGARIDSAVGLAELVNDAVRLAYTQSGQSAPRLDGPRSPVHARQYARQHAGGRACRDGPGETRRGDGRAKGGGSENKARFANLNPGASVVDWVRADGAEARRRLVSAGHARDRRRRQRRKGDVLAKEALIEPIDMSDFGARPVDALEEMRLEIYDKVNALGIGAQGLGGLTTVVDVKIASFPACGSKPVGLIPNARPIATSLSCSTGAAPRFDAAGSRDWPDDRAGRSATAARRVNLDRLSARTSRPGGRERRCSVGGILTGATRPTSDGRPDRGGRAAAVDFGNRLSTTSVPSTPARRGGRAGRADHLDAHGQVHRAVLARTGLLVMIGKAERGPAAIDAIRAWRRLSHCRWRRGLLVSKAIKSPAYSPSRTSAWKRSTSS